MTQAFEEVEPTVPESQYHPEVVEQAPASGYYGEVPAAAPAVDSSSFFAQPAAVPESGGGAFGNLIGDLGTGQTDAFGAPAPAPAATDYR